MAVAVKIFYFCFLLLIVLFVIPFFQTLFSAPFVPVSKRTARKIVKAAQLKKGENLVDLGSGSGRLLFAASEIGARSEGYELQWFLVFWSRMKAFFLGKKNIKVFCRDLFSADLSQADVITLYLVPAVMAKIEKKLESSNLKPGARIVSYAFKLPGWQPIKVVKKSGFTGPIFIYKV